tara:strand:+ start:273 stop:1217 length:945 start_codon:yes stop_codon:yes gene_type:complete
MSSVPLKAMRTVFLDEIYERMDKNENIFVLCADFGAPSLDKIREEYEDRFLNVGIAEQNLINVSTGIAMEGGVIYAYALAPFITMRAYEQIRTNLSITSQIKPINVNLIGVGAGLSYNMSGPTHHCLEDICLMRLLPNLMVFSPSDWKLAEKFVDYSIDIKAPKYIRFDAKPVNQIYTDESDVSFENGFCEIRKGERACLISTGFMTHRAINVSKELEDVGIVDMFMLNPFNEKLLFETLKRYEFILTIEEGFIDKGGLGTLVADVFRKNELDIKIKSIGFADEYVFDLGDRNHLHEISGLGERGIIDNIKRYC